MLKLTSEQRNFINEKFGINNFEKLPVDEFNNICDKLFSIELSAIYEAGEENEITGEGKIASDILTAVALEYGDEE